MKVRIRNIGMLDEADFEVGDLTLICGENNTGKTYATYSLYGYLDFIKNDVESILNIIIAVLKVHINDILMIDNSRMKISSSTMESIIVQSLQEIEQEYKKRLMEILAGKDDDFNNSIFNMDTAECINSYIKNIEKERINKEEVLDFFSRSRRFKLLEVSKEYFLFDFDEIRIMLNQKEVEDIDIKKQSFSLILFDGIIRDYLGVFILSAERTGATMFEKELNLNRNEILEQISKANAKDVKKIALSILSKKYSRYPKPVKDNIDFVRKLDEVTKQTSFIKKGEKQNTLYKEITELLYQVVGGKYIVSPEGIEFAPGARQRITKGKFLVQRASSSVRSLLMLNYYVLHKAQKGDILMIDEPELNLHPNNQILIARLLVLLVNAGIKVFITTHSDYIVRELSNCIMLNNLNDEQLNKFKKQGYLKEYKLESKKVKAYLAQNIKGKNTLKEVEITQEQGIFMETFDAPIDSQNENQGLIFEEVIQSKEKK